MDRAVLCGTRLGALRYRLPPLEQHIGGRVHIARRHGQRAPHRRVAEAHADQLLHGRGIGRNGVGAGLKREGGRLRGGTGGTRGDA